MKNKDDNLPSSNLITAMRDRRSVRAFLSKGVPSHIIQDILDAAKWAPSGVNTQPWKVAILGSVVREKISTAILSAREQNIPEDPDYHYYPKNWVEPFKSRRKACGMALYGALGIDVHETARRKEQWYRNYIFFGAPMALVFYIDAQLCKGSWMDIGMFIQNVMLAARAYGLETCPQASLAEYPDIIRTHLNISHDFHIICGMALGYADWSHPINQYRTTREDMSLFTTWYD